MVVSFRFYIYKAKYCAWLRSLMYTYREVDYLCDGGSGMKWNFALYHAPERWRGSYLRTETSFLIPNKDFNQTSFCNNLKHKEGAQLFTWLRVSINKNCKRSNLSQLVINLLKRIFENPLFIALFRNAPITYINCILKGLQCLDTKYPITKMQALNEWTM